MASESAPQPTRALALGIGGGAFAAALVFTLVVRDLGAAAGIFWAALCALVWASLLDYRTGLLSLLVLAPFDRITQGYLHATQTWYPPPLHPIDVVAVVVLLRWGYAFAGRRLQMRLQWYDWVASAFFAVLVLGALRGVAAGYDKTLAVARFIPLLVLYLPARELFSTPRNWGLTQRAIGWAVTIYCLAAPWAAYAAAPRDVWDVEAILLPRLVYVSDPRILLLAVCLSWIGLWRRSLTGRSAMGVLAALLVLSGVLTLCNTRTFWVGLIVAWSLLVVLLWYSRASFGLGLKVAGAGMAACLAGIIAVYGLAGFGPFHREPPPRLQSTAGLEAAHFSGLRPPLRLAAVPVVTGLGPWALRLEQPALAPVAGRPHANWPAVFRLVRDPDSVERPERGLQNRVREAVAAITTMSRLELLVGRGIGAPVTYIHVLPTREEARQSAEIHNSYVGFIHSTGLPGLALCLIWLLGVLGSARRTLVRRKNPGLLALWSGSALFLCASLVMANVGGDLSWAPTAFLFALSAAALASPPPAEAGAEPAEPAG